jgi:uncharacterized secreted protein with C-terminal beta-propeller domain
LAAPLWGLDEVYFLKKQSLERFSSYQELVDFLKMSPQDIPQSLFEKFQSLFQKGYVSQTQIAQPDSFALPLDSSKRVTEGGGIPDYSTTNIQVEGVDEADIVKTDGEYISCLRISCLRPPRLSSG